MNINTKIKSPRLVANGINAWEGTLAELIDDTENYTPARAHNVKQNLADRGIIPQNWVTPTEESMEAGIQPVDLVDVADFLDVTAIEHMTDDPNVIIHEA